MPGYSRQRNRERRLAGSTRETIVGTSSSFPLHENLLFALFWNSIVFLFQWEITVVPLIRRGLVVRGRPIMGRIVDKKTQTGKTTTYYVLYTYDTDLGQPQRGKMAVARELWNGVQPGQLMTVLYDRSRPRRSVIYALGNYEAVRG